MKNSNRKNKAFNQIVYSITGILLLVILLISFQPALVFAQGDSSVTTDAIPGNTLNYQVTFIELGSVKCIPCRQMQPVMQSIEKKYGSQVKIIFHDVWTAEGKAAAKQFTFGVIPTQIFLNKTGKEYYRHEGFFSEEELVKVLQQKGVK